MNRKIGMLLVAVLILSLLITVTCIPLVMATQYKSEVVKKPLLFNSSEKNIESICTDATSIPVNGPVIPAGDVVIDSATTNGQWIYLGYCDGSITNGESQYWAYDAPSGTTQTYTYLQWDNASNDLDLYTYDHNWNSVGYSYQVNTNWEAVQNTNAYKATWYFQVHGYSITGNQSYHVDVWAWVTTYDGQATKTPWSGWWWPYYDNPSYEPHLYDTNGPMQKYDSYVINGGGSNPGSQAWEYCNHRTTDPSTNWFGHCHAWSAASILENEPTASKTKNGIYFEVKDQKGLLTECHFDDPTGENFWGNRFPYGDINDVYPQDFHKVLLQWVGSNSQPVVMDTNRDVQVWNYPACKYSMKYDPDLNDPSKTHVTCTVTFVSDGVDANYVGAQTFDKTYTYYLIGGISNPTGGMWEGDSINDHPDFIWRPLSQQKLQDCPLDYNTVKQIIN
ncbi:hypothetical protein [Methanocella conradii]|uniref:hypothetical protein n=1 Tax=Methanocella conradii TaxID=1175444 RepID=UPI0024B32147|nr:hypothetical protein [Methanocella conradii]MDI6898026.1 hypothetical protein [Methanocella conradii]